MGGSFKEWVRDHYERIASEPARGLMHAAYTTYLGLWYTLTSRRPVGTHIYDEDWDVLVILDACRLDVLRSVAPEYDFIETVDSRWSVGSHSHEWLAQTFSIEYADEISDTAYISGNGHTYETFVANEYPPDETVPICWPRWQTVEEDTFGTIDMLWETAHRDQLGVPPRAITDRTVEVAREADYERVVAHYMQPHIPYIAGSLEQDREPTDVEAGGWKHLESDGTTYDRVWELYEENLRLVLDDVELLLENVDAETVVITADHGNAFGEYTVYGHPEGFLLPCIKKVPWVVTSGSDEKTYTPTEEYDTEERTDIESHLQDLGYL
ncbi:hypothetical protein [Salinilacihabitans rarus]|uniref:hypothetical protein n=1 Tax=Salinilacihabitans rarus TaxID=2961596 RepID=UPI0020C85DE7|nr:hypothetical protein [Salinilacihabitans rarus]